ncbi:MAG: glycosyltransferase family 4 protein [Alphaproteobacteria bacterium]|nr:glycosyltransferase family 4 protein [Alphaproteobacteria bacterium]
MLTRHPMTERQARPSILMVNRVYPPMRGATGRLLHDLARHFVKAGHRVTILTTTAGKPAVSTRGPISIVRIKGVDRPNKLDWLSGLWRLYRAMLVNPRHDIIITLSDPPLLYVMGQRAAKKKGCAHIHWCQDLYPDLAAPLGFRIWPPLYNFFMTLGRAALQAADCVVCISRCMQRHLVRTGLEIRKTTVIENWPDMELLAPASEVPVPTAKIELPHKQSLRDRRLYSDPSGQKFRVLYAGSLSRAHPLDAIVKAAQILQKTHPDIELVFVGKGDGFEKLAHARAQFALDNIRLIPPQPRASLKGLMESGDVHLVTMRDESLGMLLPSKFYGGIAVARPIVFAGPAESDVAHLIARHSCGRVVKPDDGKSLATAIALYRTDADAWFAAHEGAQKALVGRTPDDAFALWSDVVRKVGNDR